MRMVGRCHDVKLLTISFVQGSMGMYSGVLVRIYVDLHVV